MGQENLPCPPCMFLLELQLYSSLDMHMHHSKLLSQPKHKMNDEIVISSMQL
jgi:hypothetical protein